MKSEIVVYVANWKLYLHLTKGKCKKCKNGCGHMGYYSNESGVFYLETMPKEPYGKFCKDYEN